MESDIYSDIPSQYGLVPDLNNDIYNFAVVLEEIPETSVSSRNSFDEALAIDLSQYMNIARNDQSRLLGDDFSFVYPPILPPTFNDSVENQPL
ncbi:hypothetical protein EIK77_008178 [Talaromyces pinophilus]|nr:hypothetical protein EIK77_008178 [Talaromyces pinophilus]